MHPDLEHLIALQSQDLEKARLTAELVEAPKRVALAEAAVKKAQTALTAAEAELKKEEVLRRSQESDAGDRRAKIARLEKQLESATNTAQVTAYEHEISFCKNAISALEDEELASLERTDQQDAAKATATLTLEKTSATLAAERDRAASVKAANTAALMIIESERTRLRAGVSAASLVLYDRVSKVRGTGISEGVDHKCSACQMMVRPQRWNDLTDRSNDEALFTCEACGRLLYWDARRDAPQKKI